MLPFLSLIKKADSNSLKEKTTFLCSIKFKGKTTLFRYNWRIVNCTIQYTILSIQFDRLCVHISENIIIITVVKIPITSEIFLVPHCLSPFPSLRWQVVYFTSLYFCIFFLNFTLSGTSQYVFFFWRGIVMFLSSNTIIWIIYSCFVGIDSAFFCCWVVFHCIDVSEIVYAFTGGCTLVLFPILGCYT